MVSPKEYDKIVKKNMPRSNTVANCARAFVVGGGICTLGQVIYELLLIWDFSKETARTLTSVSMIAFGVLFTALGIYDKLARYAGSGTLVPITGFANAMSSPAIEFKSEGFITGVGTRGIYCGSGHKAFCYCRSRDRVRSWRVGRVRFDTLDPAYVRSNIVLKTKGRFNDRPYFYLSALPQQLFCVGELF